MGWMDDLMLEKQSVVRGGVGCSSRGPLLCPCRGPTANEAKPLAVQSPVHVYAVIPM